MPEPGGEPLKSDQVNPDGQEFLIGKSNQSEEVTINSDSSLEKIHQAGLILENCRVFTHEVSQPLTFLLTTLELSATGEGARPEECELMFKAALKIRSLVVKLNDLVNVTDPYFS